MSIRTQREASEKFRELIAADRIFFTKTHAIPRMQKRGITDTQVLRILKGGSVVQRPYMTTAGYWRSNYAGYSAGTHIEVVAELQEGNNEQCLVITAF